MKYIANIMYRNSWDFYEAYYRCKLPLKCQSSDYGKVLFIAAMANISFACEMYLKTFYYIENKEKFISKSREGHTLSYLFGLLSTQLKNDIIKDMQYNEKYFYKELDKYSNAFKEWRYYHEWSPKSHTIDFNFLEDFSSTLNSLCERKIISLN